MEISVSYLIYYFNNMDNQSTKLDKAVKISIIIPTVFLAVFVLSGCSKKTVIQPNVVTDNGQNQNSQSMEELKKQNEEQQKQLDILQKNQEQEACQKKKDDCVNRIAPLQKKISSEIYGIESLKKSGSVKEEQENLKYQEAYLSRLKNELAGLINGDCKDYQNPCK